MKQSSENTKGLFSRDARQKGEERLEQEPAQSKDKDTFSVNTAPVIIITPA